MHIPEAANCATSAKQTRQQGGERPKRGAESARNELIPSLALIEWAKKQDLERENFEGLVNREFVHIPAPVCFKVREDWT